MVSRRGARRAATTSTSAPTGRSATTRTTGSAPPSAARSESNRTFYFANVEANPFKVPSPNIVTVPTAKMRNGDFSDLLALGPQYQIYNPFTIRPHPTQAGRFTRDPFPGNIIPPHMIDPVAKNILEYFPLPNQAGTADGQQNFQNPTAVAFETYYTATGRVDHNISAKHRIYGRFSWDFWEEEKDDRFDNIATGIFLNRKNRILGLDDAYTFRNNLLMNVRGGFTRQMFPERRRSQGFDLSTLGFSPQLVSLAPADIAAFPFINYDGFQDFGVSESGDGYFTTDVYSVTGSLMWLVGSHNMKFGSEYRYYIEDASRFSTAASPQINFSNTLDARAAGQLGGRAVRAGLRLVPPRTAHRRDDEPRRRRTREKSSVLSFYAHDDWRVRSNLTLNLGAPLGDRRAAHGSGGPVRQRVRLRHGAADRGGRTGQLRAQPDRRSAGRAVRACAAASSIRTRVARASAWERNTGEHHAARGIRVAASRRRRRCAAATGCSTTCSARTASR